MDACRLIARIPAFAMICLVFGNAYLLGCTTAEAQRTEEIVVAPLDDEGEATSSGTTREELEDQLRRFTDRMYTRVFLAANSIRTQSKSLEIYGLMLEWKRVSLATAVEIAIGPNAVTNLLDMVVMTTLSRMVVEEYWVPERIGADMGQSMIDAYRILEDDIWKIANAVLTTNQQEDLRILINEWRQENPDQIYPWYVRLDEFSGQRAARLNGLKESGGLLKEVAKAREAAEEFQDFGERMMFYLQRAPVITSAEFEISVLELLRSPDMSLVFEDADRFVNAVEELVDVIDRLPQNRLAAIDQLMERVTEERRALIRDLSETGPDVTETLTQLRQSIESFERIVESLTGEADPDAEPFDIGEYQAVVAEAGNTAIELQRLAQALADTLDNSTALVTVIDKLAVEQKSLVDRMFWMAVGLIIVFFTVLLIYRVAARRLALKPTQSP